MTIELNDFVDRPFSLGDLETGIKELIATHGSTAHFLITTSGYDAPLVTLQTAEQPSEPEKPELTIPEQAAAVLQKIVELINSGRRVEFERDLGDNTATIYVGSAHTHVGCPGDDDVLQFETYFGILVKNLYSSLTGGPGLSWYDPSDTSKPDEKRSDPVHDLSVANQRMTKRLQDAECLIYLLVKGIDAKAVPTAQMDIARKWLKGGFDLLS